MSIIVKFSVSFSCRIQMWI